jgi:predicted RNase H-like nuclease (RuvC/YqgF family)
MSEAPDLLHDAAVAWDKHVVTFNMVLARLRAAEAEVERLRMQVVACGVVACSDTEESAAKVRDMHPDYRSVSCNDVARRVDECIALRQRVKELERENAEFRASLIGMHERAEAAEAEVARLQAEMIFDEENETRIVTALEAEVERLKLSVLAHFNEEHLAGDGPEIDRWKAEVKLWQGRSTTSARDAATYEAEVERLRGLILNGTLGDWEDEANRIRALAPEVKP